MNILRDLRKLTTSCIKHFDELKNDDKIHILTINIHSQSIWGGNGDRDNDLIFYLTKEGLYSTNIIQEFGMYQKGDGIIEKKTSHVELIELQNALNGEYTTLYNIESFVKFYNTIRKKYPEDFK